MSDELYALVMDVCVYLFFGSIGVALINSDWFGWQWLVYACASIILYTSVIFVLFGAVGLFTGHLRRWLR